MLPCATSSWLSALDGCPRLTTWPLLRHAFSDCLAAPSHTAIPHTQHTQHRWQHIFLPLLPRAFSDYLSAPMPFLIGLHAQLLPELKRVPMDAVTIIDLDLGGCYNWA